MVVDDDPLVSQIVKGTLEEAGFEVLVVHDPTRAVSVAQSFRPDALVVDRVMPEVDGCSLCRQFRSNFLTSHLPIIMLTSRGRLEDKVEGLEAGADDYLCKPFEPLELVARLRALLRRTQHERSVNPLTGLSGNLVVERELRERIGRGEKFAVLYLDIDNFKSYNDTYGFLQGDEVIKFLGELLVDALQKHGNPGDFAGHIGGDDFVAITTPDRVEAVCSYLIRAFDEKVASFYSREDRERGYVIAVGRSGKEQVFPLMSLSIAVVSNEERSFADPLAVAEAAAELKRYAKTFPGSIYVRDGKKRF